MAFKYYSAYPGHSNPTIVGQVGDIFIFSQPGLPNGITVTGVTITDPTAYYLILSEVSGIFQIQALPTASYPALYTITISGTGISDSSLDVVVDQVAFAPVTGINSGYLAINKPLQLSCATLNGTWGTSDPTIATISNTGLLSGVSAGIVTVTYGFYNNVDGLGILLFESITSVNFTVVVLQITNGFNFVSVYPKLANRVLWQSQGGISDSQRYYEDFHPLNDTALIDSMRPQDGTTLSTYLSNKQRSVILECLNAIYNAPQIIDSAKLCFFRSDVMLYTQPVAVTNSFVGIKMYMSQGDYSVKFNSLQLFFDSNVTFTMYVYNDMSLPPIYQFQVTAQAQQQVIIDLSENVILSYLTATNKGGIIYMGYYQEDLGTANALYYPINMAVFHPVKLWAYSAPLITDVQGNRNFQRNNIGANNLTYGMNLEVSTFVDATNNIVQNAHLYDELIGLKMSEKNVQAFIFSYRSNGNQNIMGSNMELKKLYAQLDGQKADDEEPYIMGLRSLISREVKRVKASFEDYPTTFVGIS